jgi:protein-L-isoaspartate(D-aspartate) O-methyltransferase
MEMDDERAAMVQTQLAPRGISDRHVLEAMRRVPRHAFVPPGAQAYAYQDRALPIGEEQTISQPYVVALMAQALELNGDERVLEIGTGSGYAAAVLSLLAREVYTMERRPALAAEAAARLARLGYTNVHVVVGDGTAGLPEHAPYDAITVAAAAPWIPQPLRDQLAPGGRLVIPVGGRDEQVLLRLTRDAAGTRVERMNGVRFVPLLGAHAWDAPPTA